MIEIAFFLALGFVGSRRIPLQERGSTFLDRVILELLLPVVVLYNISGATWGVHTLVILGVALTTSAINILLVLLVGSIFQIEARQMRTMLLVVPIGNTAYFGFSAIRTLRGSDALVDAIVFDQIGTTLIFVTWANAISLGRLDASGLKSMVSFAPLWGLAVGVTLSALGLDLTDTSIASQGEVLTASIMPLAMIALGSKAATKRVTFSAWAVCGISVRLLVTPAVMGVGVALLATSVRTYEISLLQAAMPPMIASALLAEQRGLDSNLAYSICLGGTLAAVVTVPLYGMLIG